VLSGGSAVVVVGRGWGVVSYYFGIKGGNDNETFRI